MKAAWWVVLALACTSGPGDDGDTGSGDSGGTISPTGTDDTAGPDPTGSPDTADSAGLLDTAAWRDVPRIEDVVPPACVVGARYSSPLHGTMVCMPAGSFRRGSTTGPSDPGLDRTEVTLTRGFWVAAEPATQGRWQQLMPEPSSYFADCGLRCPAERVNFYEAIAYANNASRAAGLPECYALRGCEGVPGAGLRCDTMDVLADGGDPYACEGYRLPTEAEWEYAARAAGRVDAPYPNGGWAVPRQVASCDVDLRLTDGTTLSEQAWYCASSDFRTHPVGLLNPSVAGLYDIVGNTREWVFDAVAAGEAYPVETTDPVRIEGSGRRMARGGDALLSAYEAVIDNRNELEVTYRTWWVGFRVVRTDPEALAP